MRKQEETVLFGNLTAMIDVVFQIIIFFVCTANLQDSGIDSRIKLAMAPHGQAEMKKDPLQIVVDVDSGGMLFIGRTPITKKELKGILKKAVKECGDGVPVVIRGDGRAKHAMIRTAMDTCAESGIWKIKIAAQKEAAEQPKS